ncbi:MAG: hypothetical protein HDT28_07865 [Clostridiales bacterium]|nr:hypothetical protein [Clostridiales bacterium]
MFLSLQTYIVGIIIGVVVLQYAFALFCLMKLAYFDLERYQYILWNLLILIVFFIGGISFLIYCAKHPEKRLKRATDKLEQPEGDEQSKAADEQPPAKEDNAQDNE